MQESRPWPDSIHLVTWTSQSNAEDFLCYSGLAKDFGQIVEKIKPDLIHAGPIQSVAYLPVLAGLHPLLTMSWGFDLMEDAHRNEEWRYITRFVLTHSDWFTSDCRATRDMAVAFGMPVENTTVFPWGVDLDLFNPSARGFMRRQLGFDDELLIVHTRSWEPRYGVDVALQGFLHAQRKTGNMRLFLLGGGSQEQEVRNFINENNLQDRVHFCGYKQNQDLAGYYQAADLYLSASHIDGSSVALMESMACGCIPVVSDIPANLEWVTYGKQGLVFSDGNAEDLAKQLVYAEENRRLFPTWSENARSKAEAEANWNLNKQKLLEIYDKFATQKNG